MKKIKVLSILLPLFAMTMVGCGNKEEEKKNTVEHDATYHWEVDKDGNVVEGSKVKHVLEEDATKAVASTCKEKGKKVEVCKVCNYEKVTDLKVLDHDLQEDTTKAVAATCGQEGKKVEKCKNCDYTKETPIAKTAHNLGAGTPKSEGGRDYVEYECSICHQKSTNMVKFTDYVDASGFSEADGKCSTDTSAAVVWEICLPAGSYDVYFEAKYSSSGAGKTLKERGVAVTLNGAAVTIDDAATDSTLGLSTSEFKAFTFCTITATGGKDRLTLANPYYRFVFDVNGYITFKPAAK